MLLTSNIILATICVLCNGVFSDDIDSLEVVHVIFRHGEKNPDAIHTYPTDPYKNETYPPFLQGQLTKIGRQTMYDLGNTLRKRYDNFLDNVYNHDAVEAWSSPYSRCRLSLQLVMASLFIPSDIDRWSTHLNWQPTLYNSFDFQSDRFFLNMMSKKFMDQYEQVCQNVKVRALFKKYNTWLRYIKEHSGLDKPCILNGLILHAVLYPEKDANMTLPEWTKPIYPQILDELTMLEYRIQTYSNKLRAILVGDLFRKILDDTENRLQRKSEKKFFLYSGHDLNLVHVLYALGIMYPHIPRYGACLIMEVHKIQGKHVLKVFYRDNKHAKLKKISNHKDKTEISLEEFKKIVDDLFLHDRTDTGEISSAKCIKFNVTIIFVCLYLLQSL